MMPIQAPAPHAAVYGVGTDLCDVARVAAVWQRRGLRFARAILGATEMEVFEQRSARNAQAAVRYLAGRFAAKEAFSKAIALGMTPPMTWRHCEAINAAGGQPRIVLHGDLRQWFAARHLRAHLSLSDDGAYALAFVLVEQSGACAPDTAHAASAPFD